MSCQITCSLKNTLQQELVDFLLPSFFFLFGLDLLIFLPLKKYMRDFLAMLDRKKTVLVTILCNTYFLKKSNDHCLTSDLYWTGFVFLQPILSQIRLSRKFPFMVIFSEILYWSLLRSFSFRESLFLWML